MTSIPPNLRIIIICGARRTGTTLMNQIVCSDPGAHPQVGEARLVSQILKTFSWANENYDNVIKWYFNDHKAYHKFFEDIISAFIQNAHQALQPSSKLILKAPAFSEVIDEAIELIPNSRFLVCVRHPLDQVASDLEVGLRRAEKRGSKENRATKRRIGGFAKTYLKYYEKLLAAADRDPALFAFVRYEDVVAAPYETVRRLETRLDLDLSAYEPDKPWKGFLNEQELAEQAASVPQYGAPIDQSRIGRYEGVLTGPEIEEVLQVCRPVIGRFYPAES